MKMFILAVLMMIVQCRCGPNPPIQTKASCLTFHSWVTVDQAALEQNVRMAEEYLQPIVGDRFCPAFQDVWIEIRTDYVWACNSEGKDCVNGWTGLGSIELNKSTTSLLHELLHTWEAQHLILTSAAHPGWKEKGWYDLDNKFARNTKDINFGVE